MTDFKKVWGLAIVVLLFGGSTLLIFSENTQASDPNLVAYWNFDEGTGTVASDSSGNELNGTIHGATWTYGVAGNALSFDGDDDYVDVPNDDSLNPGTGDFAVEAWFKTSATGVRCIFDKYEGYKEYILQLGKLSGDDGKIRWTIADVDNDYVEVLTTGLYNDNNWHHIVGTWESSNKILKLYVDAVYIGSDTNNAVDIVDPNGNLCIGRHQLADRYWDGIIDKASIYNGALSPDEILSNYECYFPTAPLSLQASSGDSFVNISWSAPSASGGSSITNYRIYRGTVSGSENYLTTLDNILWYNDTGVTNGQTYYYKVSAINNAGEGPQSNVINEIPITFPSSPLNLQTTSGDNYVYLTWDVSTDDGGSAITNYKIYRGNASGGETLLTTIGNVLWYNDTAVTNGHIYYYKISAVNDVGDGPLSNEVSATPNIVEGDKTPGFEVWTILIATGFAFVLISFSRGKRHKK